jgi:transposase
MVCHLGVQLVQAVGMAEPVRVRRLSEEEGRKLQRLVRRGEGKGQASVVRYRRAMVILASAGGNPVPVIARLVQTSEDRVREVIHNFNRLGAGCLDPKWAGGRPRRITPDDEAFAVQTATTRPEKLGRPFTRWSIRKLAQYLADNPTRRVKIGRERLRELLAKHGITFQRTKTWKESSDPDRDPKLDRIEWVLDQHPDRCFAFDEFGPLAIHPVGGCCWAARKRPQRLRANYRKTCGVRQFHAVYSVGDDTMWGVCRSKKSIANSLAAIQSCRAARPDGETIYVILDNLSAHKAKKIRAWCAKHNVELCFTPTYSSWANPIECHFGPLREFVLKNSDHLSHTVLTRRIHQYLRWRNANARDPEVLRLQRKRRAQIRAEQQRRWGRPAPRAA